MSKLETEIREILRFRILPSSKISSWSAFLEEIFLAGVDLESGGQIYCSAKNSFKIAEFETDPTCRFHWDHELKNGVFGRGYGWVLIRTPDINDDFLLFVARKAISD